MQKYAIITGITGQDGSYLAELLLKKGYFVVGAKRRAITATGKHFRGNPNGETFPAFPAPTGKHTIVHHPDGETFAGFPAHSVECFPVELMGMFPRRGDA